MVGGDRVDGLWGKGTEGGDGWRSAGGQAGRVRRGCLLYLSVQFKSVTFYGAADGIVVHLPTM